MNEVVHSTVSCALAKRIFFLPSLFNDETPQTENALWLLLERQHDGLLPSEGVHHRLPVTHMQLLKMLSCFLKCQKILRVFDTIDHQVMKCGYLA